MLSIFIFIFLFIYRVISNIARVREENMVYIKLYTDLNLCKKKYIFLGIWGMLVDMENKI